MGTVYRLWARPGVVRALRDARDALQTMTPLVKNCGRLCGAACCQPDETGENGMLLYPFEETFYHKPIEGFAFHLAQDDRLYKGGKRLVCEGSCPREHRPLACRLFPLRIRPTPEGAVAELDPRAWCLCPLLEGGGLRAMDARFVEAVRQAGERMMQNDTLLEALYREQSLLDEMRRL